VVFINDSFTVELQGRALIPQLAITGGN
jgi:hypothetical protein